MLPCQHEFCITCLKTLLETDSWFCPCCRRPIEVKFGDLDRPRAILNMMNIFQKGTIDISSEELQEIHESALVAEKKIISSKIKTPYSSSSGVMGYMDWGDYD